MEKVRIKKFAVVMYDNVNNVDEYPVVRVAAGGVVIINDVEKEIFVSDNHVTRV